MNTIITFILPSILGIKLFMHFNKNKKLIDLVIYYLLFLLFSNFIVMIISNIANVDINNIIDYAKNNLSFTIFYISVSLLSNIILSIIITIIDKYLIFDIEVENERKRKSSKNN